MLWDEKFLKWMTEAIENEDRSNYVCQDTLDSGCYHEFLMYEIMSIVSSALVTITVELPPLNGSII